LGLPTALAKGTILGRVGPVEVQDGRELWEGKSAERGHAPEAGPKGAEGPKSRSGMVLTILGKTGPYWQCFYMVNGIMHEKK